MQYQSALAQGAGSTLLVFVDKRAGDNDLFALQLDASGQPLQTVPFPLTKAGGNQTHPKVSWNGQNWLVVYDNELDPGSGYFAHQVAALRVSPQGVVLDATPIAISHIDGSGVYFAVASDGQDWAISYTGFSAGSSGMLAKRVAANGTVLDPNGVPVAPSTGSIYFNLGAAHAGQYLFTWGSSNMLGRRFSTALQAIDPAPVVVHSTLGVVAGNGTQYFLAWTFQNPQFRSEIRGSRMNSSLQLLDPAGGLHVSGSSPTDLYLNPLVVWDGSEWIVSWQHLGTQAQRAGRISASGTLLDPGGVAIRNNTPNYIYDAALGALPNGGALIAWNDTRYSAFEVIGVPFVAGAAGVEREYSMGSESQKNPRVTAGQEQYLVTYRALADNGSRVLAQRLDAYGQALDAEPIEVARSSSVYLSSGGAAWNGTHYLVVWSDDFQGNVFARRMGPDGTFVDPNPISVMRGFTADVAALGNDFLVTALFYPSYPQFVYSYGARVRGSDGVVLDNPAFLIGNSFATRARVTTLGGQWLVLTEQHWSHNENQAGTILAFVDSAGAVTKIVNGGNVNIQDWGSVDLASSGTSALLVCQSGSNWTNTEVLVTRVQPNGNLGPILLNVTGGDVGGQSHASVVWTGSEYVVSFQSLQNNPWFYDLEPDVYGVRLSEAGVLLDPRGFALWNGEDYEQRPDAAGLGYGRAVFAASSYVDGNYGAFHIVTRELKPDGVTPYGLGTAGCAGSQRMFAGGEPAVGAAGFALFCDRVPVVGPGMVVLGALADLAGTLDPVLGIRLHVALSGPWAGLPMSSGAFGIGTTLLPIPNDPSLRGARLYTQSVWSWGVACSLPPLGLSASDGLELVVQ